MGDEVVTEVVGEGVRVKKSVVFEQWKLIDLKVAVVSSNRTDLQHQY